MSERLAQSLLLGALILLPVKGVKAQAPEDPIYVKTSNGWNAAYAHGNEYAEFRVIGNGAKLQDAYHVLLQKGVGMMVSFVDKKDLDPLVKELVSSFKLVPRNLDAEETKRLSSEAKAQR